jgi:hypothetical protein
LSFDCDVVADKEDIHRKDSDCKLCSLEQKKKCEQIIFDLLKEFPEQPKETTKEDYLDFKEQINGEN